MTCEVGKQLANYSIQVFNGGQYPLPQTLLVVLLEVLKLAATVARSGFHTPSFHATTVKQSLKFLLPSVLYAGKEHFVFIPSFEEVLEER